MAWFAPKTDWSSADGVRNSDFNRIESNIQYLYDTHMVRSSRTIHVSPSGNDTLGTGTSASPYATFARALRDVPRDLGGNIVTVNVASGSYIEEVLISNFYNGVISIMLSGTASIKGLTVNNARVSITGSTLTIASIYSGILLLGRAYLKCDARIEIQGGSTGIFVDDNSVFTTSAAVALYDCTVRAITVSNGSFAYIYIVAGSGHAAGVLVSQGSAFAYDNFNLLARDALTVTESGGRIYTGAQSSNMLATTEVLADE